MVSSSAVPQENETGGMESISADVKGGPNNEATPTVGGGGGGTCGDICLARDASGSNNENLSFLGFNIVSQTYIFPNIVYKLPF